MSFLMGVKKQEPLKRREPVVTIKKSPALSSHVFVGSIHQNHGLKKAVRNIEKQISNQSTASNYQGSIQQQEMVPPASEEMHVEPTKNDSKQIITTIIDVLDNEGNELFNLDGTPK